LGLERTRPPLSPVSCAEFLTAGKGEEDAVLAGTQDSLLAQVLLELAAQSMEHAGVSWWGHKQMARAFLFL
jgi:hypothetical protein